MALPQSREQLKEWCLRKLGKPAIRINVADEQVEDRIDETLERFQEHHFDGVHRVHYKHQITASVMTFETPLAFTFTNNEVVIGQTSGAQGRVVDQKDDNTSIRFVTLAGSKNFVDGESVTGSSGTATIAASNGIALGDKDNEYIPIDDSIISVTQIVSMPGIFGGGIFSFAFQQALQALPVWPKGSVSYYYQQRQHLRLIEEIFIGDKVVNFNRLMGRVYIDLDWHNGIAVDDWIIIEAYAALNPETWTKVYSNYFVREYATALIKKQWGQNLTKFRKVTMPGGVTVNGQEIYEQAEDELKVLEKRLRDEFQAPPIFFIG